jgi:two-component system OmpR family response regulator
MRILLIEDDKIIGAAIREQLESDGHSIDWAMRLDAAGDAFASAKFDLLLLDLMLPDGRGIMFLRSLRKAGSKVPVMIMTALD